MDNDLSALTAEKFFQNESLDPNNEEFPVDEGQLIGNYTIIKRLTNKQWVIIEMD